MGIECRFVRITVMTDWSWWNWNRPEGPYSPCGSMGKMKWASTSPSWIQRWKPEHNSDLIPACCMYNKAHRSRSIFITDAWLINSIYWLSMLRVRCHALVPLRNVLWITQNYRNNRRHTTTKIKQEKKKEKEQLYIDIGSNRLWLKNTRQKFPSRKGKEKSNTNK